MGACHLIYDGGSKPIHFDRAEVEKLHAAGTFFWLDLEQPDADDFAVLRDVFGFHPLAIEDSENFGQRAKLDEYGDFVFLVVYGANPDDDRLVEVHCFYSEDHLITLHRDESPAFTALRARYAKQEAPLGDPPRLLYRIVDSLVDSFFPVLADLDNRIDELENAIFVKADDAQLQEIFAMKRLLVGMRKAVTPQRDLFASLMGGVDQLPGMTRGGRALLPRRLRPPDPDQRPDRHLPRPADRGDGRVPLDRGQPDQRGDEAARDHRHDLPAALVHHRLLRPELRLPGPAHRRLDRRSSASGSCWSSSPSRGCSSCSSAAAGSR